MQRYGVMGCCDWWRFAALADCWPVLVLASVGAASLCAGCLEVVRDGGPWQAASGIAAELDETVTQLVQHPEWQLRGSRPASDWAEALAAQVVRDFERQGYGPGTFTCQDARRRAGHGWEVVRQWTCGVGDSEPNVMAELRVVTGEDSGLIVVRGRVKRKGWKAWGAAGPVRVVLLERDRGVVAKSEFPSRFWR